MEKNKPRQKKRHPKPKTNIKPVDPWLKDEPNASQNSGASSPTGKTEGFLPVDTNGDLRKPVTNQDEQVKITNQGSGLPVHGSE